MIGEGLRGGSAMEQQRASAGKAAHKFQTTMIKDILGRTYTGNRTLEGNKWAVKPVLQIAKGFEVTGASGNRKWCWPPLLVCTAPLL